MRLFYTSIIFLLFFNRLLAQEIEASIATWSNNARGAYSIIHDDYGNEVVDGIWEFADTIAANRGVSFTIGAISESCEEHRPIKEFNTPYEYAKEVMIKQHGHEIISHTHTHNCAIYLDWSSNCNQTQQGWADLEDYSVEIDQSTTSIFENTGYYPRFFIYPFDKFSNGANERLKELGYIGSRSGWSSLQANNKRYHRNGYDDYDENDFYPDEDGFFRSAVVVSVNNRTGDADRLNEWAQTAITNNVWVNRELHNVGATGWGKVTENNYRSHLNFLKSKVETGELWVATVSEILTYQIQKLNFSVTAKYHEDDHYAIVTFDKTNFDVKSYLSPLSVKSRLTINLDLSNYNDLEKVRVLQNGNAISDFLIEGGTLTANIYPSDGDLLLLNVNGVTLSLNKSLVLSDDNVKFYPNPFITSFSLDTELNEGIKIEAIQIHNASGKLIKRLSTSEITGVMGEYLNSGVYYLTLITTVGNVIKKVVKI